MTEDRVRLAKLMAEFRENPRAADVNYRTARFTGVANTLDPQSPHYRTDAVEREKSLQFGLGWLAGVHDALLWASEEKDDRD